MSVAFVYPGQGSQFIGMGLEFYHNFKIVKEIFQEIGDTINKSITTLIFDGDETELKKTENAQPALMAVSIAIQKVIELETGKRINELAQFVAGHSLGEYSALCAAGSISISDTAKLLNIRGQAMSKSSQDQPGTMLAIIGADYNIVENIVAHGHKFGICQIANDNATGQVVISGEVNALTEAEKFAREQGLRRLIKLEVSGAFHCDLMQSACHEVQDILEITTIQIPEVAVISNVLCAKYDSVTDIKQALVKQITSTVRWRESLLLLQDQAVSKIYEIGAGKVLTGLSKKTVNNIEAINISNVSDLKYFTA